MKTSLKWGGTAALVLTLGGGLLWLGSGTDHDGTGQGWLPVKPLAASASAGAIPAAAPVGVAAATPAAPAAEAPVPSRPVELSPEQRRFILGEFVKAAETDIARAEAGLVQARADGAPSDDIAAREERLRTMKQILERTLSRNPGV
jgi:hypothetical protein